MKNIRVSYLPVLLSAIGLFANCYGQNPTILDAILLKPVQILRSALTRNDARDIQIRNRPANHFRFQEQISPSEPFPCPLENGRSATVPASAHNLKPGDIDIIGAVGDSLTAGYGIAATNLVNMLSESRGMVYSVGGEGTWRKFITLPNILKLYNPNLFGYSLRSSLSIDRASQFNVAENGAVSDNIPYMTKVLITRILKDPRTDLKNHWKMISIMIGGNDFCSSICYYKNIKRAVEMHRKDLVMSLRLLRDHLPRTFVMIVLPPDVSRLANFTNPPNECQITQRISCPCFVGTQFKHRIDELRKVIKKFQMAEVEVASYPEFDREDFTVAAQPLLFESKLPVGPDGFTDRSYFSADCFHFSQKAHAEAAKALWNNILEPVGHKVPDYTVEKLKCPTPERPYLATNRNSLY